MKARRNSEKGQAIYLILVVFVGLLAMVGLVIDGGRLFVERRRVQNVTDDAAMVGAYVKCISTGENLVTAVRDMALQNGFDHDDPQTVVSVNNPPSSGPYTGNTDYIEVIIESEIESTFIQLVYGGPLEAAARAVGYCTGVSFEDYYNKAVYAGSSTCNNTIDLSGSEVNLIGGYHSNNDVKISGSTNYVQGEASYVTSADGGGDKVTYNPAENNPTQTSVVEAPPLYDIEDFAPGGSIAAEAQAAGKYYSCECKIDKGWLESQGLWDDATKTLPSGIYYTTGEISLSANEINGTVTLVSRDQISFSGSDHVLRPYYQGLLAFSDYERSSGSKCSTAVVKLSGSEQNWKGIIYAPNGLIEMSGSDNTSVEGMLIGNTVKMSGSENFIQYNPDYLPPDPPAVELAE